MRPALARETEIKLEASPSFRLPDLTDVARGITARRLAIVRQRAIYMDTGDRRPATGEKGITLRHRAETSRGKRQEGLTLKLPAEADGMALAGRDGGNAANLRAAARQRRPRGG